MSTGVKSTKKVAPADLSDQPITDRFIMRGRRFVLTEVDAGTYSELMDDFTTVNDATGSELLDEDGFIRALTVKSLTEPKVTATELARMGQRLVRTLEGRVRTLHLAAEPVSTEGLEPEPDVDDEDKEGNAA